MIFLLVINLFFMLFLLFFQEGITGRAIENYNSWTKAICDETNYCQDYEIICKGNEVVSKKPVTELIKFSDDWQDLRDEETRKRLC